MEIQRSALVPHAAAAVYALIEDAERYPEYLPWCTRVQILQREAASIRARLWFGFRDLDAALDTVVARDPPRGLDLALSGWPFEDFCARWRIVPLGELGCKVEFYARLRFAEARWASLLAVSGAAVADRLLDAFIARARQQLPPCAPRAPAHSAEQT